VDLSYDVIKSTITTDFCYNTSNPFKFNDSLKTFMQCIGLIDTAGSYNSRPFIIATDDLINITVDNQDFKYGKVIEDFGFAKIVELISTSNRIKNEIFYANQAGFYKERFTYWKKSFLHNSEADKIDFEAIIDWINQNQIANLDQSIQSNLVAKLINGYLQIIDPHAQLIAKKQLETLTNQTKPTVIGIGILWNMHNDGIQILRINDNSPAANAGLLPGDIITHISSHHGQLIDIKKNKLSTNQIMFLLKGEESTSVQIRVKLRGKVEVKDYILHRENLQMQNIHIKRIFRQENNLRIAHLVILSFATNPNSFCQSVYQTLHDLSFQQQVQGLILDIRTNPGGLIMNGACLLKMLIPGNYPLVQFVPTMNFLDDNRNHMNWHGSTTNIYSWINQYPATEIKFNNRLFNFRSNPNLDNISSGSMITFPFLTTVLINGQSASVAEMVAGTMQSSTKSIIIGSNSFGKGMRQAIKPLSQIKKSVFPFKIKNNDQAGLLFTDARWYFKTPNAPNGAWSNQFVGIRPDIKVAFDPYSTSIYSFSEKDVYNKTFRTSKINVFPYQIPLPKKQSLMWLEHCVQTNGQAKKRYAHFYEQADFQVLKAIDTLNCMWKTVH